MVYVDLGKKDREKIGNYFNSKKLFDFVSVYWTTQKQIFSFSIVIIHLIKNEL